MGKKDFVFTIGDDEKVADLDNDAGQAMELNPDFTFDDGGVDFGQVEEEESSTEDQLDAILRRHGGLEAKKNKEVKSEESDADSDDASGSDASGSEDESENEDEDEASDSGDEAKEDNPTISTDKSGFFEESPDVSTSIPFSAMKLSRPVLKGIAEANYTSPTPIQSAVIPVGLLGKDIVAGAVTGSGKTAAYLIPTLERLVYRPTKSAATRVVVLTPTRELAMQVFEVGQQLGKFVPGLTFGLAVGGLSLRAQEQQLRSKPDVVVATPGRFIDHVRNSPSFNVDDVEVLVLDEADRMLEEGFEAEVTEILKLIPAKRQTLLFSATMNNSIQDLVKLSLKKPVRLMLNPPKQAAKGLVQEFVRIRKQHDGNRPAILVSLLRKLIDHRNMKRVIVFVAQKRTAHKLRVICGLLGIRVGELHGALSQDQRLSSINQFKSLEVPVLICTDLASRGLDIPKIEVVINYELPSTYDVYLHRIGRSARAGRTGTAVSFVGESTSERQLVKSAISASAGAKQKILGRNVNWDEVKIISQEIEAKGEVVEEVLAEEKTVKELGTAEKELERAQNLVDHREEIKSRPKRTWFEASTSKSDELSRKRKKQVAAPKSNSQKKRMDKTKAATDGSWAYKKTKGDRKIASQRGANKKIMKNGTRKLKG